MNKFIALMILTSALACQKSDSTTTGNPLISLSVAGSSQTATVALNNIFQKLFYFAEKKAQALPPPGSMNDASNGTVTLTSAWINVEEIELKPLETAENSEVDGTDIEFVGPYAIDLLDSTAQGLGDATISSSEIRRIKMKLAKIEALPAGAPNDILNSSIYLAGEYNGNTFVFQSDDQVKFEIAGPNAINVATGADLLVSFKIADLIKKIDLSSITSNVTIGVNTPHSATGACPLIDIASNSLYECFRKGIEQQADLGRDDDGSGELEDSEDSVK